MDEGELPSIKISPKQTALLPLDLPTDNGQHWLLNLYYEQKCDLPLVPKGHLLGFDQIELFRGRMVAPAISVLPASPLNLQQNAREIWVGNQQTRYRFDRQRGILLQIERNGTPLLNAPLDFNIWRAPLDNDALIKQHWQAAGYDRAQTRAYEMNVIAQAERVIVRAQCALVAVSQGRILTLQVDYVIAQDGSLAIKIIAEKAPHLPFLPRFGVCFVLPKTMQQTEYFAYGPTESYIDKHHSSQLGRYQTTPQQNHVDYLKPQENGSHYACHWLEVRSKKQKFLLSASQPFSFNLSPYTQQELATKRHNFELIESGSTLLCVDYKMSGIGSNSCGPSLLPQYRLNETKFEFELKLLISDETN